MPNSQDMLVNMHFQTQPVLWQAGPRYNMPGTKRAWRRIVLQSPPERLGGENEYLQALWRRGPTELEVRRIQGHLQKREPRNPQVRPQHDPEPIQRQRFHTLAPLNLQAAVGSRRWGGCAAAPTGGRATAGVGAGGWGGRSSCSRRAAGIAPGPQGVEKCRAWVRGASGGGGALGRGRKL